RAQKIIRLHPFLCSGSTGPTWVSFPSFLSWGLCEHRGHASYLAIPSMIPPRDGYVHDFAVDLPSTDY
ncbi:MAG: hypothetical protein AAB177_02970, partial [Nitrospirota bacterium]